MFIHYLKVAFRNLLRYRLQSVVSLFSLAIGFACISLSLFWYHYEETYDAFQSNHKRIYRVSNTNKANRSVNPYTSGPLAGHLMKQYPEVEKACALNILPLSKEEVIINDITCLEELSLMYSTPEIQDIFDFTWVEGNSEMSSWRYDQMAISESLASKMCGQTSPIGFKLKIGVDPFQKEYEIVAVYKPWPIHSNLNFDIIGLLELSRYKWMNEGCHTYVLLKDGSDSNRLLEKMKKDTITSEINMTYVYDVLTPLQAVHYNYPKTDQNIRISEIRLFATASILLVSCVLLNYLSLFINRLRVRGRDMALRTICGSSSFQLSILLQIEYLLLLLGAFFVSLLLIELVIHQFVELSMITIGHSFIYKNCIYLLLFVIVLAIVFSIIPIYYFKKTTLRVQMETVPFHLGKSYFRLVSVCVQLIISMLFVFCSIIMMQQTYYILHADINIERERIATVASTVGSDRMMDVLRQIPSIKKMSPLVRPLYPYRSSGLFKIDDWEGKSQDIPSVMTHSERINNEVAQFYGLKIKEGIQNFDLKMGEVLINETLAKDLGITNPVGKILNGRLKIMGVVYDFLNQPPTKSTIPMLFTDDWYPKKSFVGFKYEGDFAECENLIKTLFLKADISSFKIVDSNQAYKEYLTPEYNLLKLLGVVTVVSLLIALFGIYALIVQACEKHRKEIAIRRVNGAQVGDILLMFFKQYMAQVVVAAAVAFPVGYVLMKRWLENYTLQVGIGFWVFASIFLGTAVLVTLCIGWHVWRAANENPARVIRKE